LAIVISTKVSSALTLPQVAYISLKTLSLMKMFFHSQNFMKMLGLGCAQKYFFFHHHYYLLMGLLIQIYHYLILILIILVLKILFQALQHMKCRRQINLEQRANHLRLHLCQPTTIFLGNLNNHWGPIASSAPTGDASSLAEPIESPQRAAPQVSACHAQARSAPLSLPGLGSFVARESDGMHSDQGG
jgi:hypothetical protein